MRYKQKVTLIIFTLIYLFAASPVISIGQDETPEKEQEEERVRDREEKSEEVQERIENRERQKQRSSDRENQPGDRGFIDEDGDGFNDNAMEDVSKEDAVAPDGKESSQEGREKAQKKREQAREHQEQKHRRFDNFIDENGDGFNDRRFGPGQSGMPDGIRDDEMDRKGNAQEQEEGQKGRPKGADPEDDLPGQRGEGNIPGDDGGNPDNGGDGSPDNTGGEGDTPGSPGDGDDTPGAPDIRE
ncbi:MAG: hypothetical protein K9N00_06000 [Candidatus Marinimicrobia bacterium]|nr:hypothetical protein [Candidatus Neomarinimicrobiota bacterium]